MSAAQSGRKEAVKRKASAGAEATSPIMERKQQKVDIEVRVDETVGKSAEANLGT
jgi:hypothetical protein